MQRVTTIAFSSLLAVLLVLPPVAYAQSPTLSTAQILQLIQQLEAQVVFLQAQLQALTVRSENPVSRRVVHESVPVRKDIRLGRDFYESKYYDGRYKAVYKIAGTELGPVHSGAVHPSDQEFWDLYVAIAGENNVERFMSEFRVYHNLNARFSAFIEQKDGTDEWILGVNTADLNLDGMERKANVVNTFVHEFAHLLFYYEEEIFDSFVNRYWSEEDLIHAEEVIESSSAAREEHLTANYYAENKGRFVTEYAASEPDEDVAETFTLFVLAEPPEGSSLADKKIRFFYSLPEMRAWREAIRDSVDQYIPL